MHNNDQIPSVNPNAKPLAGKRCVNLSDDFIANDELREGSNVVTVNNEQLAVALMAVGIPPYCGTNAGKRGVKPYRRIKKADGTVVTGFNFYPTSRDGVIKTMDCVKAWSRDLDFIRTNPNHPFAYVMAYINNERITKQHFERKDTSFYVLFNVPTEDGKSATLRVVEGSAKHQAAVARGYRQL